jgi:hypothetical protein
MYKNLQLLRMSPEPDLVEVSFGLRSDILDPAMLTKEFCIEPSWSFAKGELYTGKSLIPETKEIVYVQQQRPWGIWAIDTKSLANVKEVQTHILFLLNIFEPNKGKLKKYLEQKAEYQVTFNINWSLEEGYIGGYEIDSQLLIRMSKLSHYIEFSFLGRPYVNS